MRETRFIYKYRATVRLIQSILADVNVTQSERVARIYDYHLIRGLGSDQDFYESVNWYAVKAINICSRNSLACSRRYHYDNLRYWNECTVVISWLLGFQNVESSVDYVRQASRLYNEYPLYINAYHRKISAHSLNLNNDLPRRL